jgi:ComF family protein
MMKQFLKIFFSPRCFLCKFILPHPTGLCEDCFKQLRLNEKVCCQCALPLEQGVKCGTCLASPPPFDMTLAPFLYQPPLSHWITQLKFQHKLLNAKVLGQLLCVQIEKHYAVKTKPDCIIPIPLHRQRLSQRGFNQAVEIARPIAKKLKLPLIYDHYRRAKNTHAQSQLSAYARHHNMQNAFKLYRNLAAKHVAIVDDVMTTGQTVRTFSQLLRKTGIQRIDIWCCARVP